MEYLLINLEGETAYYAQAAVEEIAKISGTVPVKVEKRTSHTFVIDGAEFAEGTAFKFDAHYYKIGPLIVLKKLAYFLTRSYIDPRIILKAIEARENNHLTIEKCKERFIVSDTLPPYEDKGCGYTPDKEKPLEGFSTEKFPALDKESAPASEALVEALSRVSERNPATSSDIKTVFEGLKEYEAGNGGFVGKPTGEHPALIHPETIISRATVEKFEKKKREGLFGLTFGKKDSNG